MFARSPWFFRVVFLVLFCSSMTMFGCPTGFPPWSGNGFIRKELLEDKKIAIMPFEGDPAGVASHIFAEKFHEKFPQIALVTSAEVLEAFPYEELYSEWIDEATRKRIGKIFGVQAIVAGNIYSPTILRWLLQIRIVDVESGQIMGRSLVEMDYLGPEGVTQAGTIAVKNLEPR